MKLRLINLSQNFNKIEDIGKVFWFSYETCVAYQIGDGTPVVVQNEWGVTTGKHLNLIDGGKTKTRIPLEQFQTQVRSL